MIQFALFFLLGVLVTVFLAVLLGPSVWRRALFLAGRQVQAGLPVTLAEIRADKDGVRAEYAMAVAKAEQQLKHERTKTAEQAVELGRYYDHVKHIPQLEKMIAEQEEAIAAAQSDRDTAIQRVDVLQVELEQLKNQYNDLEKLTGTLRQEISAYEVEHSRLSNEMISVQSRLMGEGLVSGDLQSDLEVLQLKLMDAHNRNDRGTLDDEKHTDEEKADYARQDAAIRENIAALAARLVVATMQKEGKDSPLHLILQKDDNGTQSDKAAPQSLANRISTLERRSD